MECGALEQIEEQREDVLDLVSELEVEATPIFICYTLEKLIMVLGNVISKPEEEKYKTLKMENNVFYSNIGRFANGVKLIKYLGFDSVRLAEGKLAYQYKVSTADGLPPLFLLAYDELRICLAKHQGAKFSKLEQGLEEGKFDASEQPADELERA